MRKGITLLLLPFILTACTKMNAPVEQVQKVSQQTEAKPMVKRSVALNQKGVAFHCKADKIVKVQYKLPKANKTRSKNAILVTFMETTHTLSPQVTRNGKKYSNIRWIWWERFDNKAALLDNSGKILAEDCIQTHE